jgi:hypothetical protein
LNTSVSSASIVLMLISWSLAFLSLLDSFFLVLSFNFAPVFSCFLSSLKLPHLLKLLSLYTLLLELNLTLQLSLLALLLSLCFLEFLFYLITFLYCFSSLSLTQLARRLADSATVILLALMKVKSFALLLMLLLVLKSLLQALLLMLQKLILYREMVNA